MKKTQLKLIIPAAIYVFILLCVFTDRNLSGKLLIQQPDSSLSDFSQQNSGKLNINTASATQLQLLPGVGKVLAQNIIDYREENGPFTTTDALLNVDGIGEKRLAEIMDYITVGG